MVLIAIIGCGDGLNGQAIEGTRTVSISEAIEVPETSPPANNVLSSLNTPEPTPTETHIPAMILEPTVMRTPTTVPPSWVPTATAVPALTSIQTPTPSPYARAHADRQAKDWGMAIRGYSTVIEADPSDSDAYFFRAYSYHQIDNHWPAIEDYDKVLELRPSSVAYNNRGDVYSDMTRYEQAISDYTNAIRLDPDYAQAYNSLAVAENNIGKTANWAERQACSLEFKYCPTPTPIPTPIPTPAPTPKPYGMQLSVNGTELGPRQEIFNIPNGSLVFDPVPDESGKYDTGTTITVTAFPTVPESGVHFGGLRSVNGNTGTIVASGISWSMTTTITLPYGPPEPVPTTTPPISVLTFLIKWGTNGSADEQFDGPWDIAVAPDGSVYVADALNHRIQKFTSDGVFVSKWGTSGTGDGQFNQPWGIEVAPDGSVYVADTGNNRIQKFTSNGVFVSKWGTQGASNGQFNSASGITVAPDGWVYVSDYNNKRVQKFTPNGLFAVTWGAAGTGNGQFSATLGNVAVAPDGSVYVVDGGISRIQKFSEVP